MTREQVLDKVKKLLALGNLDTNNSEEEAKAAMLKAQKLLKEYDLAIEDVENPEEPQFAVEVGEHKENHGFRVGLSNVLARNFKCINYKIGQKIAFMGHPVDAKICVNTFNYAYSFIYKKAWQEYNRKYSLGLNTKGVVNAYAYGFIAGLKEALEQQCTALMIVVPQDVKDKFERMSSDWKTSTTSARVDPNMDSYSAGKQDGKEFMSQKKVEKKEPEEEGTSNLPINPDPIIKPKRKPRVKKEYAVNMTLNTPRGFEDFVEYFEGRCPSEAEKKAYSRYKGQEITVNWIELAEEYRKNIA